MTTGTTAPAPVRWYTVTLEHTVSGSRLRFKVEADDCVAGLKHLVGGGWRIVMVTRPVSRPPCNAVSVRRNCVCDRPLGHHGPHAQGTTFFTTAVDEMVAS